MSPDSWISIHVPSSHLYRGMRLRAERVQSLSFPVDGDSLEFEILLLFSDDSTVAAKLHMEGSGEHALHVESYMTAQGTDIPARAWRVKGIEERPNELEIWLGVPASST